MKTVQARRARKKRKKEDENALTQKSTGKERIKIKGVSSLYVEKGNKGGRGGGWGGWWGWGVGVGGFVWRWLVGWGGGGGG